MIYWWDWLEDLVIWNIFLYNKHQFWYSLNQKVQGFCHHFGINYTINIIKISGIQGSTLQRTFYKLDRFNTISKIACYNEMVQLSIKELNLLQKRCVGSVLGAIITNLHFLRYLQNGPIKLVPHYIRLKRLVRDKHSSLLGPFVNFQRNWSFVNTAPGANFIKLFCP